ncbi:MAG: hypothetical protein KGL40_06535 [Rhodocyclaceae bacterium]|nr:hypothetical protein [Rhodocyclaceae bacterium]
MQYNPTVPPVSLRLLCVLCAVYLLTGLLDHDLWKYEDAVHIGVAWDMAQRGHWLRPHLANEIWNEAPLYYWVGALLGKLLGGLIGFHNAVRLATAAFAAITLYALDRIAALSPTEERGSDGRASSFNVSAPLLLICTPGLLLPVHDAQPMIAVMAGQALAYWGMAQLPQQRHGALLLTLGLVIAVLAGGFDALLPMSGLLLLPLFSARWRNGTAQSGLVIAAMLTIGVLAAAAALLPLPGLSPFKPAPGRDHFELLAWYAWPALPIALWPLWLYRRHLGSIALPLAGSIGALIWYLLCCEPRNLPALPLLLPLVLLAATGASRLRRGAANALDWFGMMTFSLLGIFLWLAEAALLTGTPPTLHKNIMRLIPGYDNNIGLFAWVFAAVISLLWILIIFFGRRTPWRGTRNWACGMVLIWCLFAALWIPPVDYGKSYATMDRQIAARVAKADAPSCVASQHLGDVQRATLDYHTGLITHRGNAGKHCDWLLVQGLSQHAPNLDKGWTKVWNGMRPSDRDEHYYLFKR